MAAAAAAVLPQVARAVVVVPAAEEGELTAVTAELVGLALAVAALVLLI